MPGSWAQQRARYRAIQRANRRQFLQGTAPSTVPPRNIILGEISAYSARQHLSLTLHNCCVLGCCVWPDPARCLYVLCQWGARVFTMRFVCAQRPHWAHCKTALQIILPLLHYQMCSTINENPLHVEDQPFTQHYQPDASLRKGHGEA